MINFNPIEIKDRSLFNKYFNITNYRNSEKNFSNLFMWRKEYDYKYALVNDFLCITGISRQTKENFFHFPYGKGNVKEIIQLLKDNFSNLIFNPVLDQMKHYLNDFSMVENRDAFDYIYTTEKLINLKGHNLRNKRRWIKKFKDNYNYVYESIDDTNIEDAKEFTLNEIKNTNNDKAEIIAMTEMFDNFFALEIKGCVIRVDGEIIGVSTGEQLTPDTVLIHCERGNRNYEGIYNVINQEFVKNQWFNYKYVNREQDLGIKGLRQAKLTYRPDILLEKYIAKSVI